MYSRSVRIENATGLHARPAGLFVETANRFRSAVWVAKAEQESGGRSILGLMLLEVTPGTEVTIRANGEDEIEAVNALVRLIENRFEEERV